MSWAEVALTDAYWFQEGPGLRKWQFTSEGIKVLNVGNIMPDGSIDLSRTDRHISMQEFEKKYSHFGVDKGDLVIASSGISFDEDGFLRTKVAFVDDGHLPLCMNTSTIRFKAMDGKSDLRFLRHWFQSFEFRRQVSQRVTGSAQQNFGPSHLKAMTIALPPLDEQKRIAAILDQADEQRRKRQHAIDRLNQLGQAIFHKMFGDSSKPEGWSCPTSELSLVCEKITDGTHQSPKWAESGIPFIFVSNVRNRKIDLETKKFVSQDEYENLTKNAKIEEGDVLYTCVGSYGHAAVVDGEKPFVFQRHIAHLKPRRGAVNSTFLAWALETPILKRQADRTATGIAQKTVTLKALKSFEIPLPNMDQQLIFSQRMAELEAELAAMQLHYSAQNDLMASLQHRAFRGEL